LAVEFPTPFPVTVRCPKKIAAARGSKPLEAKTGDYGITRQAGRRVIISIAVRSGISRGAVIDALIHEWAHAATIRHADIELNRCAHDDEWALMYGRIYRRFFDEDGWKDSEDF